MKRITNVRIVTEDEVIPDGCVEVLDGAIVSVSRGPARAAPDDVDLQGSTAVAGL